MDMSSEHAGHDHSAHAATFIRNEDGSYSYNHGAYLGHIVPGSFFVVRGCGDASFWAWGGDHVPLWGRRSG